MAVLQRLSELDLFLLTTPDDTEDAPWMVMAGLQTREVDVLLDILRLHVQRLGLPWYLESYLLVTMPRPGSARLLGAAPDLLMALSEDQPRTSWDIIAEGQPPRFVLEVSSRASWERDNKEKPWIYQAMGVPEYALFAPERSDGGPKLFGYRLDARGRLRPWSVDRRGVLWSRELGGLGLIVEEGLWLRALDAQGERLPTPMERAHTVEAEATRLREELRRLREEQGHE